MCMGWNYQENSEGGSRQGYGPVLSWRWAVRALERFEGFEHMKVSQGLWP